MAITRSAAGRLFLLLLLAAVTSGCGIIAGIFKAGVWVGILAAAVIVVLLVWLVGKARK
jgi:hypothetical protein